ncbi:DUF29 domain-containing protein [Dolichospermum sp. LEGE 00240]|jgi:hypothetical protein|uniref:DUF29 domain-containing protein n=1 Tax=Dolichospermum sp. LEGE 00240 TaxID=1828603 RepID=UPI0018800038|nr:DUF29 domain-containing protein [Dolichospermum sp. LEGE 00240]MDM3846612.1 DUF29 domain-containing protein [Aphanizomenon gracile PMC638.10]MDM3850001.1 DUF29 domain-containing protein [Aphanizomenon gracile PMC627.10]MDM3856942.1 DUF29 domain-containing protein [Aphanizomenon gracile PMC649.10]MDM3858275.1 DUF29 domain-containing protein [Aphanizomenon gracile PMC644.10]MBE9249681.1 DUF29 domain-containing protein [Dolichospermum sp. LEGE 00240]
MPPTQANYEIYEQDYPEWLDITLSQLQSRDLENIDWEHLIEEITVLGNEQRRKVESYLLRILIHLLLYNYWKSDKDWSGRGWEKEIDNFRLELDLLLESKVLYNHCEKIVDKIYIKARNNAIRKSELSPEIFPETCPYSLTEILNPEWLP